MGRGLDFGSFLTMLGKGGDSTRLLHQFYGAYQPTDLKQIPFIDQLNMYNNFHRNNSNIMKMISNDSSGRSIQKDNIYSEEKI